MKRNIIISAVAAALMLSSASCSDFLTEYSQDLAKVTGWEDLDEVLLGDCYMHSGRIYIADNYLQSSLDLNFDILHLMTDEMTNSGTSETDNLGYYKSMFGFHAWQPDTGVDYQYKYVGGDEDYWDRLYKNINVANMVLSLIDEQPETSSDDTAAKERIKGEAYFLRAVYYFTLVNLYGQPYVPATAASTPGVPVKLTETIEDREFLREPLQTVYAQILSDLDEAQKLLKGKTRKSKYHADYASALLLTARTYLYMQDWEQAVKYADMVLAENSDLLRLSTKASGDNCVYIDSPETLFSMGDYAIAYEFADNKGWTGVNGPAYTISRDMVALYRHDDLRRGLYVGETPQYGFEDAFMKYNGQRSKWGVDTNVGSTFLFRTPEAYLIKAEALAYLNKENEAKATLRPFLATRYSVVPALTETGNALIDFIREERAREFLLEGHRWYDLRRYTVCEPYKWSKVIEHRNCVEANYDIQLDYFRLEEYDAAYTLPIPRKVRNFQPSIGNNARPERPSFYSEIIY